MQANAINTNNVAFKGVASPISQACKARNMRAEAIEEGIKKTMPKSIQYIGKMSKFTGEIPNIIINALGTGLVAPIFIKYNFLSKTDDDTRTYSALRQPISAVLSVATSVAAVLPFNMMIDSASKNGQFTVKEGGKTISNFKYCKPSEKLETLVHDATTHGQIRYTSGGNKITLSKDEVSDLMNKTLDDGINDINGNLGRHKSEKIGKQISRGEYYFDKNADVQKMLSELKSGVGSKDSEKEISKYFESKIKELNKKKADQELVGIVEDIAMRLNPKAIKAKISKISQDSEEFAKLGSHKEVMQKVASKIGEENEALRAERTILQEMKQSIKDGASFKEVIKKAEKIKDNTFVYDVLNKHVDNVKANLKGYKQITGLVLSLAILPVACSILNYIYPKFMDKFFPELSDKKHKPKTQDTFQKTPTQAVADNQKTEVNK